MGSNTPGRGQCQTSCRERETRTIIETGDICRRSRHHRIWGGVRTIALLLLILVFYHSSSVFPIDLSHACHHLSILFPFLLSNLSNYRIYPSLTSCSQAGQKILSFMYVRTYVHTSTHMYIDPDWLEHYIMYVWEAHQPNLKILDKKDVQSLTP